MKATNVKYQIFNKRYEVVKCLKQRENCSKQKKVARNPKSWSKEAEQVMGSPNWNGGTFSA